MNRRSILALIGFAPLATAAAALPRVADPVKLASTGGREVSMRVGERGPEAIAPLKVNVVARYPQAEMFLTAKTGGGGSDHVPSRQVHCS